MLKIESKTIGQMDAGMSAAELGEALDHASSNGYSSVIKHAIESNLLSAGDESIYKLLRNASKFGNDHPETVEHLLNLGADPNDGIVMAYCGDRSLPVLARHGGNVAGNRHNALIVSIKERRKDDKSLALIQLGVDVNAADAFGRTPLIYASAFGRKRTFDALIGANADPLIVDRTGRGPLRYALESLCQNMPSFEGRRANLLQSRTGAKSIARVLREYLPAQPEDYVIVDAVLNDRKSLKNRLDSGLDPNTLFRGAIGSLDLLWDLNSSTKSRLEKDRKSNVRTEIRDAEKLAKQFGQGTLLMWAVIAESVSVVKLLLEYGAEPDIETENGLSARRIASRLPLKPAVKDLILNT